MPPPPDPIADLKKRLRRIDQLWEVQRGRAAAVPDPRDKKGMDHITHSGDNLGPRLSDGWSSALARQVALREAMKDPKKKAAIEEGKPINPIEQARWARADAKLSNFLRFGALPPGLADDPVPRGRPVRSWKLAAALDAMPSDAMLNSSFRMTCLQNAYNHAVGSQNIVLKPRKAFHVPPEATRIDKKSYL